MSTVPSSFSTEQAPRRNEHVLRAPVWLTCVRVLQMVLSIAIFALGIYELIDAGYMLERYLCVTAALVSMIVLTYTLCTEKIRMLRFAYHIFAAIILDGMLIVYWIAAWAATAARRSDSLVDREGDGCSTRDAFASGPNCILSRSATILALLSALGALIWILFIATFAYTIAVFVRGRRQGDFPWRPNVRQNPSFGRVRRAYEKTSKRADVEQKPELKVPDYHQLDSVQTSRVEAPTKDEALPPLQLHSDSRGTIPQELPASNVPVELPEIPYRHDRD